MEKPKTKLPASHSKMVHESGKYTLRSKQKTALTETDGKKPNKTETVVNREPRSTRYGLRQKENILAVENNNIEQMNADASHVLPQKAEVKKEPLKSTNKQQKIKIDKFLQPDGSTGLLNIRGPTEPSRINPRDIDVNSNVYGESDKNVKTPKSGNPRKPDRNAVQESRPVFDVSEKRKSQNHTENIKWQPFSTIKENIYIAPLKKSPFRSLSQKQKIDNVCNCTAKFKNPCSDGESCFNRATHIECDPSTCLAKKKCQNQRITNKEYTPLEVRHFAQRGHGLVTLTNLVEQQFIIEYVGEVINSEEQKRRLKHMTERKESNFYFMRLDKGSYIDAKRKGSLARFINHSCEPNCEAQKWIVKNRTVIGIFARKDINKNEELTFDYVWKQFCIKMPCLCGADKCSGKIGKKKV